MLDGSKQLPDIDYFQSYAPVVDFSSLRIFISYAHAKGWRLRQYDIVSAFTNARPQSQTFVRFVFDLTEVMPGIPKGAVAELAWNLC